ncbi:MAG: hypothetical protein CMK30_06720, partial [Porticoccaceae bacterium]|nr:hypothetical protein [Porticoccaceae bacterium]
MSNPNAKFRDLNNTAESQPKLSSVGKQDVDSLISAPNPELFNLNMSEESQPLFAAIKKHVAENVAPMLEEYHSYDQNKEDIWSYHPRQLELLEGAKDKAKAAGLWNFFLPNS